jgi:endonuclease/exonuclease/phosphatase family metal-dependent hydrolase
VLVREKLKFPYTAYGNAADLYGNGFFGQVTCSRYPIVAYNSLALQADPRNNEARNALVCHIELPTKRVVSVINTHLDVWDWSEKTRLAEIQQIVAYVRTHQNRLPTILLGDFNAVREKDYENPADWLALEAHPKAHVGRWRGRSLRSPKTVPRPSAAQRLCAY